MGSELLLEELTLHGQAAFHAELTPPSSADLVYGLLHPPCRESWSALGNWPPTSLTRGNKHAEIVFEHRLSDKTRFGVLASKLKFTVK